MDMNSALRFERMVAAMIGTDDEPVVVEEVGGPLGAPVCECEECREWYWLMFGETMPAMAVNWGQER